jgi:hypothetical protein
MAILLASSVGQSVCCVVEVAEGFAAHDLNTVLSAQNEYIQKKRCLFCYSASILRIQISGISFIQL